jgi:hypothetical protein
MTELDNLLERFAMVADRIPADWPDHADLVVRALMVQRQVVLELTLAPPTAGPSPLPNVGEWRKMKELVRNPK